jgi:hypothetical protein
VRSPPTIIFVKLYARVKHKGIVGRRLLFTALIGVPIAPEPSTI